MNIVAHNLAAMNAQRQYKIGNKARTKTTEKLSSGYKINRSADDAAGLAISEKMRRQIRGLNQASRNIQDGISFCQVADGALEEVHDMMNRITELAVKAANGTYTSEDRAMIDEELQHLKGELRRTFRETDFNDIKIFRMPYVPEVTGQPDDIQVFNTYASDLSVKYGGVEVNDIRYTWEEMGVEFEADGKTFKGGTYKFTTWDGERLVIETDPGEQVPNVHRNYTWRASEQGISVNGKLATTWAQMGMDTSKVQNGTYSFDYHGMTISFDVDEPSPIIEDVIDSINGDNGLAYVTWETVYGHTDVESAVQILSNKQTFEVTADKKEHLLAEGLMLRATDTGVKLVSDSLDDYTTTKWEDFTDATGKNPIVDWGLDNDGNTQSDATFDDSAPYTYTDAKTGFEVRYELSDEASLSSVKEGMTVGVRRNVVAPPTQAEIKFADQAKNDPDIDFELDVSGMSFRMQDLLGRDWDANEDTFDSELSIAENAATGEYTVTYLLKGNNGAEETFTGSISKADFEKALVDGTEMNFTLQSAHNLGILADDKLADAVVGGLQEEISFSIKTTAFSGASGGEAAHISDMKSRVFEEINTNSETSVKSTGKASVDMQVFHNANYSYETNFSVKVNPPLKKMNIQAGAEASTYIEMVWSPLNLSILGMGQVDVKTQSAAEGAMTAAKNAMHIISKERANFGAYQNRMEKAKNNVENISENTQAAESELRDADMAEEIMKHSQQNILMQAGQAMMAQANMSNQGVLSLLG